MMRWIGCALVVAAIWIVLLGLAAGLRWNTPLLPQTQVALDASDFHVVMGAGVEDGSALRVGAVGDDGNALQSIPLEHLRAKDFSTLRYRFDGFPRTLELSLVFRRADTPADVQVATIPWPGDGWRSLDLRKLPGWQGEITELGFAEYATPQIAPPSVAFRPFRFDRAELWSSSWHGGLATLYTSWFDPSPWALISISALGPVREAAQAPALMPLLVAGAVLSLLACVLILRWSRQRWLRGGVVVALAAWVLLDLRWLHDFHAKHLLTENLYAGKSWSERAQLLPDQGIAFAATQIEAYLAGHPPVRRILVASDSNYTFLRLIYLLLPLDAAPLQMIGAASVLPPDSLFVLYDSTQWHYDTERGMLASGAVSFPVEPVYQSGGVQLYRLRSTQ